MAVKMHTLVNFTPEPSLALGSSYRQRDVRSYGVLGMARNFRTRFANELKRLNMPHDVRILRTTIHADGTVETEWVG
ncbi:hypothetical protein SSEA_SKINNY_11 [Mycobacterium phage Skinny]|uniref:Uncharacterized protein n=6 Tax=Bongovirus bongo TaxID=1983750 RepID=A0A0M5M0S3_9CAUD|nr:hypothetical protein PEGLEG_10 [Mycobacterium phage PegLeg]YP_009604868.1 hypothetical protein FDH95_gp010 [Mycobacterium phage Bongo]ALF00538.1 hypothetical protein SEA_BRICOLE_10 [Mycobacterium phage Bricole]AXQ52651.1 hypothetical protein SEA_IPHANE7_10 [Mycobacterium phage IPhane7]QDH93584.1 hypothetical protein SEA_LILHOMIEP_10 [Mycobacterium phage LilhomieP]QGJ93157.1 hypothetical protein SEA_TYDAWG_10 [Mycobacterium phage TyDawg]QUU29211.1 hypothetical protein [Mycobacterium phage S